eukprot:m.114755 g.114755  ORF g.114755 m.114755 type:complete len:327 (-) comp17123_c0_seq1:329-1309(-)
MRLNVFRSLWGCEANLEWREAKSTLERLLQLRGLGYSGVEASLNDMGACPAARRDFVQCAMSCDLNIIVGAYTSWTDYDASDRHSLHNAVSAQLVAYERQLDEVRALQSDSHNTIIHVNVHSGSDTWTEEQATEFYSRACALEADVCGGAGALSASHETHRGRPLANPFAARRLCDQCPDLRLTLDASHWMVVCERLVGAPAVTPPDTTPALFSVDAFEVETLLALYPRVDHIHARVGSAQAPQVGHLAAGATDAGMEPAVRAFADMWLAVWRQQRSRGMAAATVTPEYGPMPYTPQCPTSGRALSDCWDTTESAHAHLRALFDRV